MSNLPKAIFVTGSDTGVGKTIVTAAIASNYCRAGRKVGVMKPIQTGTIVSGPTDVEFVQELIDDGTLYSSCPYSYPDPVAPLVASMLAGERIDVNRIKKSYSDLADKCDNVIVEGAGGILVPILENYFMSDLALDLDIPILIVTRPNIGTLNHTLLTLEFAKKRGLEVLGIVISNYPWDPGIPEQTNPELLLSMTGVNILGVLPHSSSISVEKGEPGNLLELAQTGLSPELGGNFDFENFISTL